MATSISAIGTHAVNDDNIKLLTIFPTEIWQLIGNSVREDPEDLFKMAKASPFLETLLEPHKDMYLLYQVLKIRDRHSNSLMTFEERPPNICDLLGTNELLKCRLVCSAWKHAVNKFLENRPHYSNLSTRKKSGIIPILMLEIEDPARRAYFRLHKFIRVVIWNDKQFPSEISGSSSVYKRDTLNNCPSPTKHLYIEQEKFNHEYLKAALKRSLLNLNEQLRRAGAGGPDGRPLGPDLVRHPSKEIHDFAKTVLDHVGPTFHHLTIKVHSRLLVSECLQRMPNLRSIYISTWDSVRMHGVDVPFPGLKHLNRITLISIPEAVCRAIFEANPWAKVVELFRACNRVTPRRPELGSRNSGVAWPANLTSFSTTITCEYELVEMPVTWKLNVLKLNFQDEEFISWSTIFRKVECYQDTLTELYLELPKYEEGNSSTETFADSWNASKTPLNLPNVKRLELKVEIFCSLDFLLGLTSLEHLRLQLDYNTETGITQEYFSRILMDTVDYNRGFSERFMECNIWKLLGNLKVVELGKGDLAMQKYKRMTA